MPEWKLEILHRLAPLKLSPTREAEIADELAQHLEDRYQELLAAGQTEDAAYHTSLGELEGEQFLARSFKRFEKNFYREPVALGKDSSNFFAGVLQDLRFALRMVRKTPGFTAIVILTLALGIGANTALFSVVNGVLLNPLSYPNANQLVALTEKTPTFREASISYPNFLDWLGDNHTFAALAAYRADDSSLTGSGEAERVKVMQVSATFFPLLGVQPVIGRNFSLEDDKKGAAPVVMLSSAFWKSKFGDSRNILGQTLTLDGVGYTTIGVVPGGFYFSGTNFQLGDVYVPIGAWRNPGLYNRSFHMGIFAIGRLRLGVTLAQARADMDRVAKNLAAAYPNVDKNTGIVSVPLKEQMVQGVRLVLLLLLAAVAFVLAIACVNVANLLLARSTRRAPEFAIRAALGASQVRVIRQLLTESVLLVIAGGGLGLLLAAWGTQAALKVLPEALPRANEVRLDAHVLLFTFVISIFVSVLFGLVPALKTSHPDLHETLKEGGRGASKARYRTQGVFVMVEMALAVVLLVGSGLMIRSLTHLWSVNPGFNPDSVLTFNLTLSPSTAMKTPKQVRASLRKLTQSVAAVPGVQAVSLSEGASPMNGDDELSFWVEGQPKPATQGNMDSTLWYLVGPDYLKVMGIPLLWGRFLTQQDDAHSPPVCVIDETFARKYFPNQNPVGQRINLDNINIQVEVVGVVGHVKQWGLDENTKSPVQIQLYTPMLQLPDQFLRGSNATGLVVRKQTPEYASTSAIRGAIERINSEEVPFDFETMDEIIADSLASRRFTMILLGVFASLALVLASIGIYGVMSYLVGQRTHEIGLRLALGAQRSAVLRLVLGQAARMTLTGVVIGLASAVALTRLMKAMLFGVSATDPLTFLGVAVVLTIVALAACYIPARRAMKVDPMVALRYE